MLQYVSVDVTGRTIADLPNLKVGSLKTTIGKYETASATLPLDGAPGNWRAAIREHAAAVIALDDDGDRPLWGGIVNEAPETHLNEVQFSMVTAEEYLNRRFVGDRVFAQVGQNIMVKTLVEAYAVPDGLPFRVQVDGGGGKLRDKTYEDKADKTVYAALDDLSNIIAGPEWTVEWERVGELIRPVLRVADRLGSPAPAGLGPAAWFTLPGSVTSAQLSKSTKGDDAANDVMATSTGTEDVRLQSTRHVYTGDGRPKLEHRWSPNNDIKLIGTLEDYAEARLAAKRRGAVGLEFTANRQKAPRYGAEWRLGDDIGFDLTAPAWPNGLAGTARVVGVELTDTTITPTLVIDPVVLDTLDTVDRSDDTYMTTSSDGTYTLSGSGVKKNPDGTWTAGSRKLTQRPDGTWTYTP